MDFYLEKLIMSALKNEFDGHYYFEFQRNDDIISENDPDNLTILHNSSVKIKNEDDNCVVKEILIEIFVIKEVRDSTSKIACKNDLSRIVLNAELLGNFFVKYASNFKFLQKNYNMSIENKYLTVKILSSREMNIILEYLTIEKLIRNDFKKVYNEKLTDLYTEMTK